MPEKTAQKEPGKKSAPSKKPKPQQEVVVQIPLSELHPFPDHPFQVREDASMQETAESVKDTAFSSPRWVDLGRTAAINAQKSDGKFSLCSVRFDGYQATGREKKFLKSQFTAKPSHRQRSALRSDGSLAVLHPHRSDQGTPSSSHSSEF